MDNKTCINMYERNGVVGILIVVLLVMLQIQFSSSLEFSTNDGILNYGAINKITGERISGQKILHYSKNWVKYNKQGFPTEMYYNYSKKIELSEITEINEPKYEPKKRSFKIKTKNGEVVPKPLKDKKLKDHFKSLNLKNNKVYVRIQFEGEDGNPSPEEVEILERDGIKLLDWHGDHIYYARVPKTILETKSYDFIRWIGINEDIKIKKKSRDYISSNDVDLILIFYEDITNEDIEDIKNIQGIKIIEKGLDRLIVEVNSGNVDELLSINSIKKAEIYLKPQLTLDNSVNIISADFVWNQPNIASGITIGVIDSGIEHNHSHFSSTNIYDAKDYTDNDNYPEIGTLDHGVHVAGIISGSGNYNGRTITGASYGANLVIQRVFNATGYFAPDANESDIWENILDPDNDNDYDEATSADIISNSWSIEWPDSLQVDGDYSTTSEQVDITVNGGNSNGKKVPVIFAAGNDYGRGSGYLKVDFPGTSKNAITVGATGDYFSSDTYDNHGGFYDSDNLYVMDYSERGTDDGRVKPDILAPGSDITSSVLGDTYVSKSGTSMAAPHVSAVAAQILYAYPTLSPAGVKAFIISGAVGGGTTDNININQGWGRLNADRAVYKLADEYIDSYDENTVDENIFTTNIPSTRCYNIVVPSNANKFITTLVWDDIPGDKSNDGTNTLYNDIDLWLKYPNGTILSWTEDDDSINNVEKYVLNDPISGDWNVCVSQIDLDGYLFGSQDYAISIVVLKETSTPTLNVDLYLENGAVEPGASTTVYANIDVEGLLGYDLFADLDVSGGLTITSGEFDGSDSDKDRIGDISVGRNRNTRTWTIRGDTEGARTISINITGKRIDGSTYSASDSITLNVQSGGDPGGNSSTIDCEGNYSGYEQCIRYEAGNCDVEIATNYYDNVNNIRWGLVNGSSNPYVINNYTVGWRGLDAEKEYYDVNNPSADCVSGGCTSGELLASFGTKQTVIATGTAYTEGILGFDETATWFCWAQFNAYAPSYNSGAYPIYVLNCYDDGDCLSNQYCSNSGTWNQWSCLSKISDGVACTLDSTCNSGYCDDDGIGLADDDWCFTPFNNYFDGQETNYCESSTGNGVLDCDERQVGDDLNKCVGVPYYEDECSSICNYQDVTSIFECDDVGCSCFEPLCDGLTIGDNITTCSSGQTYFADECNSISDGDDRGDNICRSNTFASGCTADTQCDGIEAGTGRCNEKCEYNLDPPTNSTILHPNGGENFNTTNIIINWTLSTDPDNDFVTYLLQYSNNSGINWFNLASNYGYENKLNDSSIEKELVYSGNENKTVYLRIPKKANITRAKFDLTGYLNG